MSTVTSRDKDYLALNASLNLYDAEGNIQFDKDKEAVRQYFLNHVNANTVFFHDLEEKLDYLVENEYYERDFLDKYTFPFIKSLYKRAYAKKYRFATFVGAYKYYNAYTLKTFDGKRYLERYEDRVVAVALYLAAGDEKQAVSLVDEIMSGRFQPATPTFLNAGKKQRGDLVSCFLLRGEDSMESIARNINASLQLSKRGGGVALLLTNLREEGAPIKKIENQSSGVIPVMKMLEDAFSYANQMGARNGSGAVYLNVHHPDIMKFLDSRRENADEKIRIKTLSLGVVVPDITFELAKNNEDMYLFSPYDVERIYGKPMSDISITEHYREMVDNPEIRKKKIKARQFFQELADVQVQSGYPYVMFEDTVNRANPIEGRVNMSNLCVVGNSRILTDAGYRKIEDLYETQEDFKVVADLRARDMDLGLSGTSLETSTRVFKTAEDAPVFHISTTEGYEITATEWHKFYVARGSELVKIPLAEVVAGDKLLVQSGEGVFNTESKTDLAYLAGAWAADGTFSDGSARMSLYGLGKSGKAQFAKKIEQAAAAVLRGRDDLVERQATTEPVFAEYNEEAGRATLSSAPLAKVFAENGVLPARKVGVPEFVWNGDRPTQEAFISGLFGLDGTLFVTKENVSAQLGSVDRGFLVDVQRILLNLGVYTRIYAGRAAGVNALPDGQGGMADFQTRQMWSLRASARADVDLLATMVSWKESVWEKYAASLDSRSSKAAYRTHKHMATVQSVEFVGYEDVYDVTVDNGHSLIFNGIATGNCSEILQVNTPSTFHANLNYDHVGRDISCNLASLNVARAMESPDFGATIETAMRALTSVSDMTKMESVPSIEQGNDDSHAVGLGQMNLHGYFGSKRMFYGEEESLDFTSVYFALVNYHSLVASNKIAQEKQQVFTDFDKSDYADKSYFEKYLTRSWLPTTPKVRALFEDAGIHVPTIEDWSALADKIARPLADGGGLYHAYRLAVPPTGSISYLNNSTASIHPITSQIEIRKESKLGRVYYPAYGLTNDNREYYQDAYTIGNSKIIDVYARATEHTDQGLSCTFFYTEGATTRTYTLATMEAWKKGLKTIYYSRIRAVALEGTESEGCVSCAL